MSVLDHYVSLANMSKRFNIPFDVTKIILEYEKLNIMKKKDVNYVEEKIFNLKDSVKKQRDKVMLTIHKEQLPYKTIDINSLKIIIEELIEKNKLDLMFSHFCCRDTLNNKNPKGVVFICK